MKIKDGVLEIPGNTLLVWLGELLQIVGKFFINLGEKSILKGNSTFVSNATYILYNPFTLIVSFVVNNTQKYQLILTGNYISQYKIDKELNNLTEEERFQIIYQNRKLWYLKTNET